MRARNDRISVHRADRCTRAMRVPCRASRTDCDIQRVDSAVRGLDALIDGTLAYSHAGQADAVRVDVGAFVVDILPGLPGQHPAA